MKTKECLIASVALLIGACAGASLAPGLAGPATHARKGRVSSFELAPRVRAPHGKAEVRHLARGDAAYLGWLRMEAGASVPPHRDATEEYVHVLEGTGTILIDGERFDVAPRSTIFMPAHAEVSFQNGDTPMVALQVFAGPAPAAKYESWTPIEPSAP